MSVSYRYPILFLVGSGFFVALDQWLKFQSLHAWSNPHLLHRFLGWQPFLNPGIAFGLPLPNWLIITLTIPILCLLAWLLVKSLVQFPSDKNPLLAPLALMLLLVGALSNLFDRLAFHHTVDYLLILTSIFNIADLLIVVGGVLYYCHCRKTIRYTIHA